jgi:hypothetical protein
LTGCRVGGGEPSSDSAEAGAHCSRWEEEGWNHRHGNGR